MKRPIGRKGDTSGAGVHNAGMPTTIVTGNNGLQKVVIDTPHGVSEVYRLGANMTRYAAKGREVIFVSKSSAFQVGKPIRGGVPICWPWFGMHPGDPKLPQHGFARTREWEVKVMEEGRAVLELRESEETRKLFPRAFRLRMIVTVGADGVTMALESTNLDPVPFTFGDAMHTYFAVPHISGVSVTGFKDHRFRSKTEGGLVRTDVNEMATISAETDRLYFDTFGPHEIHLGGGAGVVRVHKSNSADTVFWNPWETKGESLPDLVGNQWPWFVCVETVNTGENSITLAPGQSHTTMCRIEPV